MSRSYRNVRPSLNRVYSVFEVQVLCGVCRNTVSNWVREGLRPSYDSFPQLFRGEELKRFHDARMARARRDLRFGEFKCVGCGAAVFPDIRSVRLDIVEGRPTLAHATCCDCGARILKFLGATECAKVQECLDTNTELSEIDEYQAALPARIGKDSGDQDAAWFTSNDRIIHEWQIYAGRFSGKTQQAYLVSIRDFEGFIGGDSFDKVTTKRVGAYRDHLVERHKRPKDTGGLSNSTVRHRASHLSAFFKWLRGQPGYRRLSSSIPDYFALPRATSGVGLKERQKSYPSLDVAWAMVDGLPARTLTQRRDRAMVAFAFVSGFRAGALCSLRFRHLDLDNQTVAQDATDMRAKNGKSYRATWFPRTDAFQEVFLMWLKELRGLGFRDCDALFPEARDLRRCPLGSPAIAPLASSRSLQTAFGRASARIGKQFTPHSARHTLKALGAKVCRTNLERKAWSMNLGHSDEKITERYYGKMPQAQCAQLMDALRSGAVFTEEESETIIDFYEGRFMRGTEEYWTARRLAEKREKARGDETILE